MSQCADAKLSIFYTQTFDVCIDSYLNALRSRLEGSEEVLAVARRHVTKVDMAALQTTGQRSDGPGLAEVRRTLGAETGERVARLVQQPATHPCSI